REIAARDVGDEGRGCAELVDAREDVGEADAAGEALLGHVDEVELELEARGGLGRDGDADRARPRVARLEGRVVAVLAVEGDAGEAEGSLDHARADGARARGPEHREERG